LCAAPAVDSESQARVPSPNPAAVDAKTTSRDLAGHNPNGSTSYGTLPNEYALPFTLANPAPVSGMGFWTSVDSAAAKKVYSVIARIYDTDTAGAPNQVLAETMLTVGSTLRVWSCQLESTLVLQPGNYFASYEPYEPGTSTTVLNSPETTDGTNQLTTKAYWRRPSGTSYTAWAATGIVDSPWFEIHRAGVNAPVLSNTGVPEISKSFSVDLSGAPRRASGPQRARSVELDVRPDPAAAQSLGPLRELLALGFARHHGADGGRQ
jgi:hypothetical protein